MTKPSGDPPEPDESEEQPEAEAGAKPDQDQDQDQDLRVRGRDEEYEDEEYDEDDDDDDSMVVPRLPRGRGFRFAGGDLIRIAMFATLLIAVVMLRKPCSQGVAKFVGSFDLDAGVAPAPQPLPEGRMIRLRGDETEDELRQLLNREAFDAGVAPAPQATDKSSGAADESGGVAEPPADE